MKEDEGGKDVIVTANSGERQAPFKADLDGKAGSC